MPSCTHHTIYCKLQHHQLASSVWQNQFHCQICSFVHKKRAILFSKKNRYFRHHREKPLALYIFSKNVDDRDIVLKNTSCGGVTVNDTALHLAGSLICDLNEMKMIEWNWHFPNRIYEKIFSKKHFFIFTNLKLTYDNTVANSSNAMNCLLFEIYNRKLEIWNWL